MEAGDFFKHQQAGINLQLRVTIKTMLNQKEYTQILTVRIHAA
jgi:hypothetical protein